jgi:hypothetical protein
MGLANTIQKAAQTAFKAIGDIPLTCTYTSVGASIYDPQTGGYDSTDTPYTGLKIVFEDFNPKEVNDAGGAILATDRKASIPNINLTPTPKITDFITDSDSVQWSIKDVLIDPARALWLFQVRRSA